MSTALVLEPEVAVLPPIREILASLFMKKILHQLQKAVVEIVTWKGMDYLEPPSEDCSIFPSRIEIG